MADGSRAVGQQEEGPRGAQMLAGVLLTEAKCWEPCPGDSPSGPDLGSLSRGHREARAALHPPPKVTNSPYRHPQYNVRAQGQ